MSVLTDQVEQGERAITGIMLESFLTAGNQSADDLNSLVYGQSITDACLALTDTTPLLAALADAVRTARL